MIAADLVLVFALILVNGFFAMSELAIVSARRARLQNRANMGSRGARVALELSDDPSRFLSTVQIGITLIGILAGAFSGATIAEHFATSLIENGVRQDIAELVSIGVVVIVLTFVSLVIGELVPKRLALTHPDAIASRVVPAIELVARVTHPVVALLAAFHGGSPSGTGDAIGASCRGHGRRDQRVARRRRTTRVDRFFRAPNG